MVLLGIDPGFRYAGFGILRKEKQRTVVLDYGYLRLPQNKTLIERTGLFHEFFDTKIKAHQVTHISLETPFLGKNTQSFLKLGYLRGILYLLAHTHALQVHEFAPRQVKQALTGFGGASKEQVATVIARLFPKLSEQCKHDVTDALAITLCGMWSAKSSDLITSTLGSTPLRS